MIFTSTFRVTLAKLLLLVPPGTSMDWSAIRMYLGVSLVDKDYSALAARSSGVAMTTKEMMRSFSNVSYAHFRIDRIAFTAAMPLFAISNRRIGRFPLGFGRDGYVVLFCLYKCLHARVDRSNGGIVAVAHCVNETRTKRILTRQMTAKRRGQRDDHVILLDSLILLDAPNRRLDAPIFSLH